MGDIDPLFQFHLLNDAGKQKAIDIAKTFTVCLSALESQCPEGREFSIVRTKLEEACFFAKKSMAMDPSNQQ